MLKLECEALAEEGHDYQAFVEACGAALQACALKAHGVLIYSPVAPGQWHFPSPLIEMPTGTQPQAMADMGFVSAPLALDIPVPKPNIKQWHPFSDQGMPDLGQDEEAP